MLQATPEPSTSPTLADGTTEPPTSTAAAPGESVAAPGGSVAAQLAFTSYLRVFAIVGVVLVHSAGLTYINDDLRNTAAWWVASLATISTKWAVPTFVMVSGALLLKPPADLSATVFYRRRLSRIGIPLVFWHVFYITVLATLLTARPNPLTIIGSFLRGESYTGGYFFWLILGLYVITPLLWPLVASTSPRTLGIIGALLAAAAAVNLSTLRLIGRLEDGNSPAGDPTLFTQFVPYVGFFILGYALRGVIVRGRAKVTALAVLTTALCLEPTWQLTGPFVFGQETADNLNLVNPVSYQGWSLGLAAVAVFVLAQSIAHPASRWAQPRAARWARQAGDLTLGVYATHLGLLMILTRIPGHSWPDGAKTMPQLFALCTLTVLGAFAMSFVLKRIPLLRRTV